MARHQITFKCPFCNQADITADFFPSIGRERKSTWGGSKPTIIMSGEELLLTIEKCPSCGKSGKDILKAYGKGREIPHTERLKRLQEAGLPTKIENYK